VIGTPGTLLVVPGHARLDDRICEIRPGYLIVQPVERQLGARALP
jgi:hypothetical protein